VREHHDMQDKVVLITGGNSGIGLEAGVDLARMGATVLVTARDEAKGAAAVDEIRRRAGTGTATVVPLDLASFASIERCAAQVLDGWDRLDVLINNAGGILSDRRETEEGFEMTFGVNHLGHFLLTELLADRLQASAPARIVNVASLAHRGAPGGLSFADLQRRDGYNATQAYNESKLANILFTVELAERLAGTGVTANACHPGAVRSGFASSDDMHGISHLGMRLARPFMIGPGRGADPLVSLASSPRWEGVTGIYAVGGYVPGVHQHTPSKAARDPQAAAMLWAESERLVAAGRAGSGTPGVATGEG